MERRKYRSGWVEEEGDQREEGESDRQEEQEEEEEEEQEEEDDAKTEQTPGGSRSRCSRNPQQLTRSHGRRKRPIHGLHRLQPPAAGQRDDQPAAGSGKTRSEPFLHASSSRGPSLGARAGMASPAGAALLEKTRKQGGEAAGGSCCLDGGLSESSCGRRICFVTMIREAAALCGGDEQESMRLGLQQVHLRVPPPKHPSQKIYPK